MGARKASENIYCVGVSDRQSKVFDILTRTDHGTTYNSYLVTGQSKTVLFETVKASFCEEFLANINQVCSPADIDYIVLNHTEQDHSGCLERLLKAAPNATVLASVSGITFLEEMLNIPFTHQAVSESDLFDLGGMTLRFLATPMLHWPDTMFSYIPELQALFTCDCFSCHYAGDGDFIDQVEHRDIYNEAYKDYFDTILSPFKDPHVKRALTKIKDLPITFIGNGHGPVLRQDTDFYIDLYRQWCQPEPPAEKKVVITYVTAYGYTAMLAEAIEAGLREQGIQQIQMFELSRANLPDAKDAMIQADGILLGSPTLIGDALPIIYEILIGLNPTVHRGKMAAAFGSYGWSGEAVHNITTRLEQLHMKLPFPGLRVRMKPTGEELESASELGRKFAKALLSDSTTAMRYR